MYVSSQGSNTARQASAATHLQFLSSGMQRFSLLPVGSQLLRQFAQQTPQLVEFSLRRGGLRLRLRLRLLGEVHAVAGQRLSVQMLLLVMCVG